MQFKAKTEEEIVNDNLIPDKSICDFEVIRAEDKVSKKGNDMIMVVLTVYDAEGKGHTITDYLMEAMLYKLLHASSACGLMAKYELGNLNASDFEGKSGKCKVGIDPGTPDYPLPKNVIKDYVKKEASEANKIPPEVDSDSIPF